MPPSARWPLLAETAMAWAREQQIVLRDAIVLVPFLQLLGPARASFANATAWMPRIETTQTLAASLGPAPVAEAGQISFDTGIDRLAAIRLLRAQTWGLAWARRDPRGFERATAELVAAAHALARSIAKVAPDRRADHWAAARRVLAPTSGPGAEEQLLARVALEWAAVAPAPATDRLFDLRPSAWIVVQAGGADALCTHLLAQVDNAFTPCLLIDTDAPDDQPFAACRLAPSLAVCDDFEAEANCAAAQVLDHLSRGEQPIALVAEDRLLVRRVRALLERHDVSLHDETGWKLSTTRAASRVTGWLATCQPEAATDVLLDWLKSGTRWSDASIASLEASCRRRHLWQIDAIDATCLDGPAARAWPELQSWRKAFASLPRQPLDAWLAALARVLHDSGLWLSMQADDAGRQVLKALHLHPLAPAAAAWRDGAGATPLTLSEFDAWVRQVLEDESFLPTADPRRGADVVITPLARVMLRPFAAVVLPGADDRHLGGPIAPHPLFSEAQLEALGLPTAAERRGIGLTGFVQALAVAPLTLLRRRVDGAEPLAASVWVERLGLALAHRAQALFPWHDPRLERALLPTPIHASSPSAAALLPARWSASALEALRACPYRFFALHMLRLREDDELDGEIEKRDFGNWLHAVLHRFHLGRAAPASAADEIARLQAQAHTIQAEHGFDAAEFLPFAAWFADFAPRYIAWLHRRDHDGAQWLQGEQALAMQPAELQGITLHGVIDRVDRVPGPRGGVLQLIDYKTGSASALDAKVREPLEDTQLAFYAALMRSQTDAPLAAAYLALDGMQGIEEIVHQDVETSACALLEGAAHDIARLQAGAGMPPLGAGSTCDFCEVRGICRRDHWSAADARE